MKFILSLFILYLFIIPAIGASFDCNGARTADEISVCNNAILSRSDELISDLYTRLRRVSTLEIAKSIQFGQRKWLRARRECEQNIECLSGVYKIRLEQLRAMAETDPTACRTGCFNKLPAIRKTCYSDEDTTLGRMSCMTTLIPHDIGECVAECNGDYP